EESARRVRERIRWAVPTDATHAYVTRVKLKGDQNPLEGCDWITPARVKKVKKWKNRQFDGWEEKPADPVGADEPEKTVITRAWRRVGLLAAAEIPELRDEEARLDAGAVEVAATVTDLRDEEEARELSMKTERQLPPKVDAGDPYQIDANAVPQPREAERVEVTPKTAAVHDRAAQAAAAPDPYDDDSLLDLDDARLADE